MSNTKIITAACGVVAAAGLIATGATLSNAATPAAQTGTGTYSNAFGSGVPSGDRGHGSNDTPVTGTELSKVKAAVKAKDSAVTVTDVRKDPDGSYDVFGTKSGSPVMLEVSKDLKTITTRAGRGPGGQGHGGQGRGMNDTPVTGTELSNVKAAVKAKDSTVTVTDVRKDPDGSYDVFGTKSGSPVMLEVSKDLKTITAGPGRGGHGGGAQPAPSASSSSTSTT